MRKTLHRFTLLVALLAIGVHAFAGKVSVLTAQATALSFFKLNAKNTGGRNSNFSAVLKYTKTEVDGTVDFYVFDLTSAPGFVIISGDDQLAPVIAYSLESNFNTNTQNQAALQTWMNHAAAHAYSAIQRHTVANSKISGQWSAYTQGVKKPAGAKSLGVAPLLQTAWDQEPYYNKLCSL